LIGGTFLPAITKEEHRPNDVIEGKATESKHATGMTMKEKLERWRAEKGTSMD
jgi:hypothetical protein